MNALVPTDAGSAMRLAEMMSAARTLPEHLRRNPGDCLMVVEQAMRWGMSPFAVAQCTSVIHGKLMFEGKLVAAALNSSGILTKRLDYEFRGEGETREVIARGVLRGEDTPREITAKWKDAKTSNEIWKKQPDQQLVYYATRVWARRHAPEVMLGVYAPEEFDDPKPDNFAGTTIEAKAERPQHPQSNAREQINESVPLATLDEQDGNKWLKNLDVLLHSAYSEQEVVELAGDSRVEAAIEAAPPHIKKRINDMLTDAYARVRENADSASEDGLEIQGEKWAGA